MNRRIVLHCLIFIAFTIYFTFYFWNYICIALMTRKRKQYMQVSKLINDTKQWKIKEIMNKIKSKKEIWYKIKWLNWNHIYDQWLLKEELKHALKLKQ